MSRDTLSGDSLANATRSRVKFSGHGESKGAAGFRVEGDGGQGDFLSESGETAIVNPHEHGYENIRIGVAWDNIPPKQEKKKKGLFDRILKPQPPKPKFKGVDLDLGCLYELQNGKRGCVQAFGEMFGSYENSPYMDLSGDERTGDAEGDDEYLMINGKKWPEIKRLLIYVYIYDGAPDWGTIRPQIHVNVTGEPPMIVVPNVTRSELSVCVIAGMENVRNGIRLLNHTEYFPGHAEMDRAFGYGLEWSDGQKV